MAQNHHYVPRFLLKLFAADGRDQVHVYDKHDDRAFTTNIRNVACERGFYELDVGRVRATMEPSLGAIEATAAGIIRRIIRDRSLARLSYENRVQLAQFYAVQHVRSPATRLALRTIAEELARSEAAPGEPPDLPTEDDLKFATTDQIRRIEGHVRLLLEKAWVLCEAPPSYAYYMSDNPVTLYNEQTGVMSIGVPGIQVNAPVSPQWTITMYCKTVEVHARQLLGVFDATTRGLSEEEVDAFSVAKQLVAALDKNERLLLRPEECLFLNELQVSFASRFVFSSRDDFDVARRTSRRNPGHRHGVLPRRVPL